MAESKQAGVGFGSIDGVEAVSDQQRLSGVPSPRVSMQELRDLQGEVIRRGVEGEPVRLTSKRSRDFAEHVSIYVRCRENDLTQGRCAGGQFIHFQSL